MRRIRAVLSISSAFFLGASSLSPQSPSVGHSTHGASMNEFPRSAIDKKVDKLGAEILSEEDAQAYVEALAERFGLDETQLPGSDKLKLRLARAEFAAVREPSRRIPEAKVADVFNEWMDEMDAPKWARASVSQVHNLRLGVAKVLLPHVVDRSSQGDILNTVRPAEAIYLLWLVEFQFRTPPLPDTGERSSSAPRPFEASRPTRETLQRLHSYETARQKYFNRQLGAELQLQVMKLFDALGLD
jgi:hypothetical protein